MTTNHIRNPHLEGDSFRWQAGQTGVLLIHGYTATTAEVRLLARRLHERGYTVSGPLLSGHGTSPAEMNRKSWRDWTRDAERAYAELVSQCERVWVGGESMGALLALYLASEHPEIRGVLTYAPALLVPPAPMALAHLLSPFVPHVKKVEGAPTAADARWQGYGVNPLRAAVQLNRLQREVKRRLPGIHQPLLVVQGRLDTTIDPRSGEVILRDTHSKIKELHWLENSTHCVILDQEWEKAAELSLDFVEKVETDGVDD